MDGLKLTKGNKRAVLLSYARRVCFMPGADCIRCWAPKSEPDSGHVSCCCNLEGQRDTEPGVPGAVCAREEQDAGSI